MTWEEPWTTLSRVVDWLPSGADHRVFSGWLRNTQYSNGQSQFFEDPLFQDSFWDCLTVRHCRYNAGTRLLTSEEDDINRVQELVTRESPLTETWVFMPFLTNLLEAFWTSTFMSLPLPHSTPPPPPTFCHSPLEQILLPGNKRILVFPNFLFSYSKYIVYTSNAMFMSLKIISHCNKAASLTTSLQ